MNIFSIENSHFFAARQKWQTFLILHKSFLIASFAKPKNLKELAYKFSDVLGTFFFGISHHRLREEIFLVVKKSQVWNNFKEDNKKWIFLLNSLMISRRSWALLSRLRFFRKMFSYMKITKKTRLLIDFSYLLFVISFVHMVLCLICCCLFCVADAFFLDSTRTLHPVVSFSFLSSILTLHIGAIL